MRSRAKCGRRLADGSLLLLTCSSCHTVHHHNCALQSVSSLWVVWLKPENTVGYAKHRSRFNSSKKPFPWKTNTQKKSIRSVLQLWLATVSAERNSLSVTTHDLSLQPPCLVMQEIKESVWSHCEGWSVELMCSSTAALFEVWIWIKHLYQVLKSV